MTRRPAVPASPSFDAIARGAPFRDLIAIVVTASPQVIFQALHEVTLRDVWVDARTESLLVAMLMHVSLTASLLILNPIGISGANLLVFSFAFAALVWAAVTVIAARRGCQREHRPIRSAARAA